MIDITKLQALIDNAPGSNWTAESLLELRDNINALLAGAADLPEYADNAAALADSAPVGSMYRQPSGAVYTVQA